MKTIKSAISLLTIACLLIAAVSFFLPASGMFFSKIVMLMGIGIAAMCVLFMAHLLFRR